MPHQALGDLPDTIVRLFSKAPPRTLMDTLLRLQEEAGEGGATFLGKVITPEMLDELVILSGLTPAQQRSTYYGDLFGPPSKQDVKLQKRNQKLGQLLNALTQPREARRM